MSRKTSRRPGDDATITSMRSHLGAEDGWILVPAFILMTVVLALGFALLAVVDRQTSEARAKRTTDAAQALTDGVASSAGKALASFDTLSSAGLAAAWPTLGACQLVRGTLAGGQEATQPGETSTAALARNIRNAVKLHFDEVGNDYVSNTSEATKWTVQICPDRTDGSDVWADDYLSQPVTVASNAPRRAVWVRAQADIRAASATVTSRSRASAVKVRQASAPFTAPEDLAIGAASFSTDLGTGASGVIQDGAVGKLVLQGLLGQGKLIQSDEAKIGLRCGLLDVLKNPQLNLCVGGALGGVNNVVGGVGNTLSLPALGEQLGGILGTNRTVNLADYQIAPDRARAAFAAIARSSGTYVDTAVAGGNAGTAAADTSCFANVSTSGTTLTAANTANKVVYIRQVGNGGVSNIAKDDPLCTVPPGIIPAVLVIERGGARVTSAFTGVLYAANRQEIDGATTAVQIAAKRKAARLRETIRIEEPGKVTGAVWTDGAGGQAGLYPATAIPTKSALLAVGGGQGICSLPLLGPALTGVSDLLTGVVGSVGQTVANVFDSIAGKRTQTQTRYPTGTPNPTSCDLLKRTLGNLTESQIISLFGPTGRTVDVVVAEQRTRTQTLTRSVPCLLAGVLGAGDSCWEPNAAESGWSAWSASSTKQTTIPSLLTELQTPAVLNQLVGTLGSTLSSWTAVDRNIDRIRLASVGMAVGSETVPGSYRSVQPLGSLIEGGP